MKWIDLPEWNFMKSGRDIRYRTDKKGMEEFHQEMLKCKIDINEFLKYVKIMENNILPTKEGYSSEKAKELIDIANPDLTGPTGHVNTCGCGGCPNGEEGALGFTGPNSPWGPDLDKKLHNRLDELKYYTPKIEEFHFGFEYEVSNALIRGVLEVRPELEWYHYKFINIKPYDLEFIEYNLNHKLDMIRVKYLDREDVESLGFIQSRLSDNCFLFKNKVDLFGRMKSDIGINFNQGKNHVLIYFVPDGRSIPAGINLFVGDIKNKSELKRLLTQLQIIKE